MGRVLHGLSCGLIMSVSYLLMSELTLVRWRGVFGTLVTMMINMGFLIGLILGAVLPVKVFAVGK